MPVSGVYQIHPPGPLHLFFHGLDNNEAVITKLENYIGEGRMRALHEINLVLGVDISQCSVSNIVPACVESFEHLFFIAQ